MFGKVGQSLGVFLSGFFKKIKKKVDNYSSLKWAKKKHPNFWFKPPQKPPWDPQKMGFPHKKFWDFIKKNKIFPLTPKLIQK